MSEINNEQEQIDMNSQNSNEDLQENNLNEVEKKENIATKVALKDSFLAAFIDIISIGVISAGVLFIFDAILRVTAGFYVKEKIQMLGIIYLIVMLLYTSIMESSKSANTIGKRVANLKITKI